jgi:hypothetical protein
MGGIIGRAFKYDAGTSIDALPGSWPDDGEASTNRPALRQISSWIAETFVDGLQAESALCTDRSEFIKQRHIMKHIPNHIMKRITHPDAGSQIQGFEDLFLLLDTRGTGDLHRLVTKYFHDTLPLRPHLSKSVIGFTVLRNSGVPDGIFAFKTPQNIQMPHRPHSLKGR